MTHTRGHERHTHTQAWVHHCLLPQVLSHVTLEKEDDATLLLCTATSTDFVKVRVGLYLPCLRPTMAHTCHAPLTFTFPNHVHA